MKLQQLRYLCEIVDHGMNLSAAAATLHTSQSGISRYVKALEDELGTPLLVRHGKRILATTAIGDEVLRVGRKMLFDAERIRRVTLNSAGAVEGDFVIATTHLHARYALPRAISAFMARHAKVHLSLRQGNPTEIADWVARGEVDLGIAAAPLVPVPDVALLPCYELHRVLLAPSRHPIRREARINLATIAQYPMITYDSNFPGRVKIAEAFAKAGLQPRIALSATDADLIKTYVRLGFGIAIVGEIAYNPREDKDLRAFDVRHLFSSNTIFAGLNRSRQPRGYMLDFIQIFAPHLDRATVERALSELQSAGPGPPRRRSIRRAKPR